MQAFRERKLNERGAEEEHSRPADRTRHVVRRSGTPDSNSRAWLVCLALGMLTILGYLLLPFPAAEVLLYNALVICALAAIVAGIHLHRPAHSLVWYLLAAGQLMFVVGDWVWGFYEFVLRADPFPSQTARSTATGDELAGDHEGQSENGHGALPGQPARATRLEGLYRR